MMIYIMLKVILVVLYIEANFAVDSVTEDVVTRRSFCGVRKIKPSVVEGRIIGGDLAVPGSWPWQVLLYYRTNRPNSYDICGGSIINERHVLTAAHCFAKARNKNRWRVYVGGHFIEPSSQRFLVQEIHYYPDTIALNESYPPQGKDALKDSHDDIAVIKLKSSLNYSDTVNPVCLATSDDTVYNKTLCVTTGYGLFDVNWKLYPLSLMQLTVKIIPKMECEKLKFGRSIANTMICAGQRDREKDTCTGDSGGPLVCYTHNRWTLYGVTSLGDDPCGRSAAATIYTYVPKYVDWINSLLNSKTPQVSN